MISVRKSPASFSAVFLIALYVFGALLCIIDTYWSIAFIVIVQLNYAIAPSIWQRLEERRSDKSRLHP
jgi:hypothetical protein